MKIEKTININQPLITDLKGNTAKPGLTATLVYQGTVNGGNDAIKNLINSVFSELLGYFD